MKRSFFHLLVATLFTTVLASAQPAKVAEGVSFVYTNPEASSVSLVGDFNAWSTEVHPMSKSEGGGWGRRKASYTGLPGAEES